MAKLMENSFFSRLLSRFVIKSGLNPLKILHISIFQPEISGESTEKWHPSEQTYEKVIKLFVRAFRVEKCFGKVCELFFRQRRGTCAMDLSPLTHIMPLTTFAGLGFNKFPENQLN